jgi:hypothetical protein
MGHSPNGWVDNSRMRAIIPLPRQVIIITCERSGAWASFSENSSRVMPGTSHWLEYRLATSSSYE